MRHHILASKIANFPISDDVYNWIGLIFNFLSDRQHYCQHINSSIVQGSDMGPVAYLLNASYLRPIDQNNMIFKYADDTYLIVSDSSTQTIPMELLATYFCVGNTP